MIQLRCFGPSAYQLRCAKPLSARTRNSSFFAVARSTFQLLSQLECTCSLKLQAQPAVLARQRSFASQSFSKCIALQLCYAELKSYARISAWLRQAEISKPCFARLAKCKSLALLRKANDLLVLALALLRRAKASRHASSGLRPEDACTCSLKLQAQPAVLARQRSFASQSFSKCILALALRAKASMLVSLSCFLLRKKQERDRHASISLRLMLACWQAYQPCFARLVCRKAFGFSQYSPSGCRQGVYPLPLSLIARSMRAIKDSPISDSLAKQGYQRYQHTSFSSAKQS